MDEVVRILCDLVALPSVNPAMRASFGAERAEAEVANYVEDFLTKIGLDCHRQQVFPQRENVLAFAEGKDKNKVLILEAHMDTVPGDTMTIPPFTPQVKDGKVFGRGSCDTKASLASMMVALKESVQNGAPPVSVLLAATVDEEHGYSGVKKMVSEGVRATFGIVGEPTDLDIVTTHKGAVRFEIRTKGKSAHSSNPDEGVNAIYRMAKVIPLLERYHREVLPALQHPLVGAATLSIGLIQGGQAPNVVADVCEITVDRRTLPGEDPLDAFEKIKEFLTSQNDLGFDVEFLPLTFCDSGMDVPQDSAIVQRLKAACEKVLGRSNIKGVAYGTDASKLTAAGIPTIVFGPGSILQAHSPVEFVEIEQLKKAKGIYRQVISAS